MYRWKGKVALITGASAGIGREICKVLAKEEMKIVGCARRIDRLQDLSKEINSTGGIFTPITCDLTKEEEIYSLFSEIKEKHGGVDVCINNAGFSYGKPLMEGKLSEWRNMFDVNVIATCLCTQLTIKSTKDRNLDNGHIININSLVGHKIYPLNYDHIYSSTKFAITSLTEGFRQELRGMKSHIRITSISPGIVETEFTEAKHGKNAANALYSSFECLLVEDISKVVKDVLSSNPRAEINEVIIRPTEQVI